MAANDFEPAAFVFPLPKELKNSYLQWCREKQDSGDQGLVPVFIPVYPAYPGFMPYPVQLPPGQPAGGPCDTRPFRPTPAVNPFILFLILILLVVGFKKDQILSAIKKLLSSGTQK